MLTVKYRAKACKVGTQIIVDKLRMTAEFDLVLCVQDLRPRGMWTYRGLTLPKIRGVFAAYCDILFDKRLARIAGLKPNPTPEEFHAAFQFSSHYPNGTMAFDGADRINEVGAIAANFTGTGISELEVLRVRMKTGTNQHPYTLTFTPDVRELPLPQCYTLVFGNTQATPPEESIVSPDEISLVPSSLSVVH